MNPKISKLKTELSRIDEKMSDLSKKRKNVEAEITELENADIVGIVRSLNIDIDELPELLKSIKERSAASET